MVSYLMSAADLGLVLPPRSLIKFSSDQPSLTMTPRLRPKFLIVDDNKIQAYSAKAVFEARGIAVTLCFSGKQAVRVLEGEAFDAVFMDIDMPEMSGIEATARIRASEHRAKRAHGRMLVFGTVSSELCTSECVAYCRDSGMDRYVMKPLVLHASMFCSMFCVNGTRVARFREASLRNRWVSRHAEVCSLFKGGDPTGDGDFSHFAHDEAGARQLEMLASLGKEGCERAEMLSYFTRQKAEDAACMQYKVQVMHRELWEAQQRSRTQAATAVGQKMLRKIGKRGRRDGSIAAAGGNPVAAAAAAAKSDEEDESEAAAEARVRKAANERAEATAELELELMQARMDIRNLVRAGAERTEKRDAAHQRATRALARRNARLEARQMETEDVRSMNTAHNYAGNFLVALKGAMGVEGGGGGGEAGAGAEAGLGYSYFRHEVEDMARCLRRVTGRVMVQEKRGLDALMTKVVVNRREYDAAAASGGGDELLGRLVCDVKDCVVDERAKQATLDAAVETELGRLVSRFLRRELDVWCRRPAGDPALSDHVARNFPTDAAVQTEARARATTVAAATPAVASTTAAAATQLKKKTRRRLASPAPASTAAPPRGSAKRESFFKTQLPQPPDVAPSSAAGGGGRSGSSVGGGEEDEDGGEYDEDEDEDDGGGGGGGGGSLQVAVLQDALKALRADSAASRSAAKAQIAKTLASVPPLLEEVAAKSGGGGRGAFIPPPLDAGCSTDGSGELEDVAQFLLNSEVTLKAVLFGFGSALDRARAGEDEARTWRRRCEEHDRRRAAEEEAARVVAAARAAAAAEAATAAAATVCAAACAEEAVAAAAAAAAAAASGALDKGARGRRKAKKAKAVKKVEPQQQQQQEEEVEAASEATAAAAAVAVTTTPPAEKVEKAKKKHSNADSVQPLSPPPGAPFADAPQGDEATAAGGVPEGSMLLETRLSISENSGGGGGGGRPARKRRATYADEGAEGEAEPTSATMTPASVLGPAPLQSSFRGSSRGSNVGRPSFSSGGDAPGATPLGRVVSFTAASDESAAADARAAAAGQADAPALPPPSPSAQPSTHATEDAAAAPAAAPAGGQTRRRGGGASKSGGGGTRERLAGGGGGGGAASSEGGGGGVFDSGGDGGGAEDEPRVQPPTSFDAAAEVAAAAAISGSATAPFAEGGKGGTTSPASPASPLTPGKALRVPLPTPQRRVSMSAARGDAGSAGRGGGKGPADMKRFFRKQGRLQESERARSRRESIGVQGLNVRYPQSPPAVRGTVNPSLLQAHRPKPHRMPPGLLGSSLGVQSTDGGSGGSSGGGVGGSGGSGGSGTHPPAVQKLAQKPRSTAASLSRWEEQFSGVTNIKPPALAPPKQLVGRSAEQKSGDLKNSIKSYLNPRPPGEAKGAKVSGDRGVLRL